MDRREKCALLESNATMRGFFELLCWDKEQPAAYWLSGDEERFYTFGELKNRVLSCAASINDRSAGKAGDWVALSLDTCPEWAIVFWGLLASGRKPLLLDPQLDDKHTQHLIDQAAATAIISRKPRHVSVPVIKPDDVLSGTDKMEPDWADLMAFCTSGTTATSRVFVYNGKAVCKQAIGIIRQQFDNVITREERGPMRTLCFLPLNHIFGFMTNMIWTSLIGYPQVFLKDRSPETILRTCRRLEVQFMITVPMLINNVSNAVLKRVAKQNRAKRQAFHNMQRLSLRAQKFNPERGLRFARKLFKNINENLFGDTLELIVVGGSHTPKEHLRTMNSLGYAIISGYGMTETGIPSAECFIDLDPRLTGSVGCAFPITDYKIRPDGKDINHGELLVRCEAMHIGRLVNGRMELPLLTDDGYYETGDMARIGGRRRVYIEGRIKDVIVDESGENIYPDELEDAFGDIEGIDQFSVLGTNDENGNEIATLVYSLGARCDDVEFLTLLAAETEVKNMTLPPQKRVRKILVTPSPLPVVNSIKVKRLELRHQIEKNTIPFRELKRGAVMPVEIVTPTVSKVSNIIIEPETLEGVRKCFAEVLGLEPEAISDTAHFVYDLGGDSLQSLSISLKIEEMFGLLIDTEEFARCTCIRDVAMLISAKKHGVSAQAEPDDDVEVTPITQFEDTPEYAAFMKRLESMEGGHNPYFVCHESPLSDVSIMNGREVLNFGSYNYAGMSGRPETEEAAKRAIDKYGTSASGSRLLAGEKMLHQELERELAEWKHSEAALVLVGGHSTNVTLVGNFCGKGDLIVYDAIAHNSVQEGCRLSDAVSKPFPHNDMKALESILKTQRKKFGKVLIIVEGAYSMDGDIAPIPELVELKKKYGCFLMVDEAHSACVIGATGGGVDEYFGLEPDDIDIKMGTLSKGLGTCGGYIAGKKSLIEYFRYSLPGFVFSVGMSPPLAAASLEAIRLLKQHPEIMEHLHRNIEVFVTEAKKRDLNTCLAGETAIIPILVGSDEAAFALSNALYDRGVFAPPAVYPAVPKNKARLRFCVISEHKPEQIVRALDILVATARELNIDLPHAKVS